MEAAMFYLNAYSTTLWVLGAMLGIGVILRLIRDTTIGGAISGRLSRLWVPLTRFVKIASPYWFSAGIWSYIGMTLVMGLFVASYLLFQDMANHMDAVTKWVLGAMSGGYMQFTTNYLAPAVVGTIVLVWLCRKFWPRNENLRALLLLGMLLVLMANVNSINAVLNYAYGDITNAAVHKDPVYWSLVYRLAVLFGLGTVIVVLYSYVQSILQLSWRRWLTRYYMEKYFRNRNYYRINWMPNIDNPDERIANDVDSVVSTALSLLLTVLGGIITYITFIGILNNVDPTHHWLAIICYVWSAGFTIVSLFFGRKLVSLNYNQLRREADFRYNLIHVRNNTESIAFYRGEESEAKRVNLRFQAVLDNWNQLIGWTRNFGFVQTGSDYFTTAIPYAFLGSMLLAGTVEVGAISQVTFAFSQVLSALTLVIANFRTLSAFTATINRLYIFVDALDAEPAVEKDTISGAEGSAVALDKVTLYTPDRKQLLVKDLTFALKAGERIVVMGPSGAGKSSLMRGLAGLPNWDRGSGQITRLPVEKTLYLPQRPYMGIGSLRELLLYPHMSADTSDEKLLDALKAVNLPDLAARYAGRPLYNVQPASRLTIFLLALIGRKPAVRDDGSKANANGLSIVRNWSEELSLGEQQRLAFARVLLANPEVAFMDEATSALDVKNEEHLYSQLKARGISCISVGHRPSLVNFHDRKLELTGQDGGWSIKPTVEPQPGQ